MDTTNVSQPADGGLPYKHIDCTAQSVDERLGEETRVPRLDQTVQLGGMHCKSALFAGH
jgi:hypothetical protein